jgi:acetylornithine deacetylase/succinyl-diaminopimelate desuccinylase-like protein
MRAALRWFASARRWIDEQHLAVCSIPAPTFFEQRRAEFVRNALVQLGWDASLDRAGNVVARLAGAEATRRPGAAPALIALTAHLDTVLAPQSPADIHADERRRLAGPGVSDNGPGLAALLAIARAAAEFRPFDGRESNLVLVANVGEEGEGNLSGMRYLCTQSPLSERLRAVLVLDGPDTGRITAEALACRRYEITVHGPGGHSWSDHGMANPIHALARAITLYTSRYAPAVAELEGRCSYNFGVIDGGTTVNAIPVSARAKLDLRSDTPAQLDALVRALPAAIEEALAAENGQAGGGRVTARCKQTGDRPGGRLAEDSPLLAQIREVDAALRIKAGEDCASTDANIPLSLGLPALAIGAGGSGGGAHTPAEWYSPEHRELGLRRILLLLGLMIGALPEE